MIPVSRSRLACALALCLAPFLTTTSAQAGVAGKTFAVTMPNDEVPTTRFSFSSDGGFSAVGRIGFYETDGHSNDLFDLFLFGIWVADAVRNDNPRDTIDIWGIHFFGELVIGGGTRNGQAVSFFGSVGDLPDPEAERAEPDAVHSPPARLGSHAARERDGSTLRS